MNNDIRPPWRQRLIVLSSLNNSSWHVNDRIRQAFEEKGCLSFFEDLEAGRYEQLEYRNQKICNYLPLMLSLVLVPPLLDTLSYSRRSGLALMLAPKALGPL